MKFKISLKSLVVILTGILLWGCSEDEPQSPNNGQIDNNEDLESFTVDAASPVVFSWAGESKTVIISIVPEYLNINYDVKDPLCSIKLNYDGGYESFNNGAYPVAIEEIVKLKDGQYEVKLTDKGDNIFRYSENVYFSLNYRNPKGMLLSANSDVFRLEYKHDSPVILDTGLPVVVIDIPNRGEITSKTDWKDNIGITIYDEYGKVDYEDHELQMKGRGNSTWGYPKKPYALKLNKKEKILGMNKHKRWCLLANYLDRTMIRNAIAFEISNKTGLAYTPSGRFVELIVNRKHQGNYYLTEQIKVDKNRVNITDPDDEDLPKEGDFNTRGYIFELDIYFDEVNKFKSSVFGLPYMFKDPDEVVASEVNYIQNYVREMEESISRIGTASNGGSDYNDYLDAASFVDWWLVNELMTNSEPNHPKSSYMWKDVDGKFFMGPVWDFDWATLTDDKKSQFSIINSIYYGKLFQDPEFVSLVKSRFAIFKPGFEKIPAYIEDLRELLRKSDKLNFKMWGYTDAPNYDASDYDRAISNLKAVYTSRLNWLSTQINSL